MMTSRASDGPIRVWVCSDSGPVTWPRRDAARVLASRPVLGEKVRRLLSLTGRIDALDAKLDRIHQGIGRLELQLQDLRHLDDPADREFGISSQWGEDGLIQAIIRQVPIGQRRFVEFGVENYTEANTRFLLCNDNWSGLVMDGALSNIESIRRDPIYWRYDLKAQQAFITRENIDELLRSSGFAENLDLLSIDIDGNDYWIWQAISVASPTIVIVEYNSIFGPNARCSIPYRSDFRRHEAHHSNLYYGASVGAFELLGRELGYRLVCGNKAGNNLFFVRDDLAGDLPRRTPEEVWVASRFREARDASGRTTFLRADQARQEIEHLPVVDISDGRSVTLAELLAA